MEIKIYREPENQNLLINEEELAQYHKLVNELGISSAENKCPNVYICLNAAMNKQLRIICSSISSIEQYSRSTIPVEVLHVCKLAKDNEMFEGFEIWFDDIAPDPLLIGWKYNSEEAKQNKQSWHRTYYLIARWGDCALELPKLLKLGFNKMKQSLIDQSTEAIGTCKAILANPDVYVRKALKHSFSSINISI